MTWTELSWQAIETGGLDDLVGLATHFDQLRSALAQAVAGTIPGAGVVIGADLATVDRAALPEGFVPVGSFGLLGTPRRSIGAALDPSLGTAIGEIEVTADGLAGALLQAVEGGFDTVLGEGIGLGESSDLPTDDELLLIRVVVASAVGDPPAVGVVLAVPAATRDEFAAHLGTLQALASADADYAVVPVPTLSAAPDEALDLTVEHGAIRPAHYPEFSPTPMTSGRQSIDLLLGVNLQVTVEIGRARLPIRDVLALNSGSIVELDKLAGEKVDVLVNGHRIATGEVVVVDENFGVRITDVISPDHQVDPAAGL